MSRRARRSLMCIGLLAFAAPLAAQEAGPPQRIDILVDPTPATQNPEYEECTEEQLAATISGEIVVCRRRVDDGKHRYSSDEEAANRYARETMDKGAPRAPNPCGPNCGIFTGPPTVGGLCIPGLQKCPPPPAYMIDFSTLPEPPPGSDADRISRGLPPLGREVAPPNAPQPDAAELGLPPVAQPDAVNPSESASPAAEPSG